MSALSKTEIINEIKKNSLVITPIFDEEETFDNVSVNVRLGNEFIIMKRQSFPIFDIAEQDANVDNYQKKIKVNYGEKFILHPNELILSSTLEYISMPKDLMCYTIGKSSWGRVGLIIATAIKVDPGFQGCITLEIINEGETPLVLYPGVPIAQLVFHKASSPVEYNGEFKYSVSPVFPDFSKKAKKWKFWINRDSKYYTNSSS